MGLSPGAHVFIVTYSYTGKEFCSLTKLEARQLVLSTRCARPPHEQPYRPALLKTAVHRPATLRHRESVQGTASKGTSPTPPRHCSHTRKQQHPSHMRDESNACAGRQKGGSAAGGLLQARQREPALERLHVGQRLADRAGVAAGALSSSPARIASAFPRSACAPPMSSVQPCEHLQKATSSACPQCQLGRRPLPQQCTHTTAGM